MLCRLHSAVCSSGGKIRAQSNLFAVCAISALFGLAFAPLLESSHTLAVLLFLCIGLSIMGLTYGPIGTVLSEIFPIPQPRCFHGLLS